MDKKLYQHEEMLKEVFTYAHLPAIIALIGECGNKYTSRIQKDEFETIVAASSMDTVDEIKNKIMAYTASICAHTVKTSPKIE